MTKETFCRSLVKSVIWRGIATISTFSIAYFIDNNIHSAIKISILDCTINFTLYFIYERGFSNIKWGYIEIND